MTICTIDVHSRDVVSSWPENCFCITIVFSFLGEQDDQPEDRLLPVIQLAISTEAQVGKVYILEVSSIFQVGRCRGGLLCQHMRRPIPILAWVPGLHPTTRHYTPHRQVDGLEERLLSNVQVLHHSDPIAPPDHGRSTFWSRWHGQDWNDKGPREGDRDDGLCLQLLRANGLSVLW